jgi:hypothetical protein
MSIPDECRLFFSLLGAAGKQRIRQLPVIGRAE